ncbi:MAG: coproporphyrinogen dehydrogenase HemZ [Lachnospiraceae bacterium]|nr:coproporphyrinogen dehydrogenase HemZ [Lachnospiraceae bacterium]
MIEYILDGHSFDNEVQTMVQVFYPNTNYILTDKPSDNGITVLSRVEDQHAYAFIYNKGVLVIERKSEMSEKNIKETKRCIKLSIYNALKDITGIKPPWGILTGIRPTKIINSFFDEGKDGEYALSYMTEKYLVDTDKALLALEVAKAERDILKNNTGKDMNIYIGIPFCPTRCLYCSFTSYPFDKYSKKIDTYIDCVLKELKLVLQYSKGRVLKTVYIGGGTPTSLSPSGLWRIISFLKDNFDFSNVSEFTVEGGRPDTLDPEKLSCLKKGGVSRLSINPQTMNERTLLKIGRKHSPQEIINAFHMAREAGFDNINADIILGLPDEEPKDVLYTLEEIKKLSPENLTVHTLAVKRASKLKENFDEYKLSNPASMEEMLDMSVKAAYSMGMSPYYMYRQKNMIGSFENVGYSKPGCFGIYNVQIMEERQDVIAVGAGAISKTVDLKTGRIDRIFNVKSVDDYMFRIEEMLERKRKGLNTDERSFN